MLKMYLFILCKNMALLCFWLVEIVKILIYTNILRMKYLHFCMYWNYDKSDSNNSFTNKKYVITELGYIYIEKIQHTKMRATAKLSLNWLLKLVNMYIITRYRKPLFFIMFHVKYNVNTKYKVCGIHPWICEMYTSKMSIEYSVRSDEALCCETIGSARLLSSC